MHAVDFFCGAGGMTYGLRQSGVRVLAGVDNDPVCSRTYTTNNPEAAFLKEDVFSFSPEKLSDAIGITRDNDRMLFVGCSPCQYWSKIRTDRRRSLLTKDLLQAFERFVAYFRPGYVVIENVPGLKTKRNELLLINFHKFLSDHGYRFRDSVVDASRHGVPQHRLRYLLIATRHPGAINLPGELCAPVNVSDWLGAKNGFPYLSAGVRDAEDTLHTCARLSDKNLRRIRMTKHSGGDRSAWAADADLQIPAYEGKDHIFRDVYGRMRWNTPAPTITTKFHSLSNGRFGHPDEDRALSLREGATLQTFPRDYRFFGNIGEIARQIGNAVPPRLAESIGSIISAHAETHAVI
jgi:DNA (cytosine-5)-methyltransferase 1